METTVMENRFAERLIKTPIVTVQLGYCDSDVTVCLLILEYAYYSRQGCKVSI